MNSFDEKQPEENDPEYEELMTLLQHANLDALFVEPQDQAQAVSNVRARLFSTDTPASQSEHSPEPEKWELGSLPSKPKTRRGTQNRRGRLMRLVNELAAVLVVAVLISSALVLFRPHLQSAQAPASAPKTVLIRIGTGPILPGHAIVLHGEGFSPHGLVGFLFDGSPLLLDQNSQLTSALFMADAQGTFTTTIVLDSRNLAWHAGLHVISAEDAITKHVATLHIVLSPAPIGAPS